MEAQVGGASDPNQRSAAVGAESQRVATSGNAEGGGRVANARPPANSGGMT
jgi:hypothetical protein